MNAAKVLALLLPALASACAPSEAKKAADAPKPMEKPAQTPEELVKQMNAAIDELQKKPEHKDAEVTIQHLLVGVKGALPKPNVTRSAAEAETLAAELYSRAKGGEDFDTLIKNYTDDSPPGIYVMTAGAGTPPKVWARTQMVPAFGDVAWRLQVGEFGCTRFDGGPSATKPKSQFGYHIIKRLK